MMNNQGPYDPSMTGYYNPYMDPTRSVNPQQNNAFNKPQMKPYSFVNGIEGAKAFPIPSDTSMLLMDAEQMFCYMKTSDRNGKCSLRYFKLEELDESQAREILQPAPTPQVAYATKEDIDNLNKKFDELLKGLGNKQNKKESNKDSNING